jgi:hypothetical protein
MHLIISGVQQLHNMAGHVLGQYELVACLAPYSNHLDPY